MTPANRTQAETSNGTPTTVVVFGVFDLLHPGHLSFLEAAKKQGDKLIVVVSRNERVKQEKGREPVYCLEKRIRMLSALDCVDEALAGDRPGEWTMVMRLNPDIICVGYDQNPANSGFLFQLKNMSNQPKILILEPYKSDVYKTSILREKMGV